ncbi:MAG: histidinol-phosphate transaminase [Planctomycetota bacterium]|jgi:histidinol-phosphate aminotransferase
MSYFRDNIEKMSGYVPGEQPAAGTEVIKLNTNENPYPPSPKAMAVLREFGEDQLRRYPHPLAEQFREVVSGVLGVPVDWILPGNGSDDLIVMITRACASADRPIVYPVPTFEFYLTQGCIQQAGPVEVPFDDDFNLPIEQLIAAGGAVTFIANPNSPSGTTATCEQLEELAKNLSGVLAIDEAYVDFADADALELTRKYDNVVVLRSLSKGYSLAGLRVGFAIANPDMLEGLAKVKDIYNVSALGCVVAAAAFADQNYKNENAEKIKASRRTLASELEKLGFRVFPSQANFLLVRPPAGDAEAIYQTLKRRRILVRYFKGPRLSDKLRITVGTDEQNAALIEALRA